jgi:hypothetical protein
MIPPVLLAAGAEETSLRFKSMPPLWILIMVVLPAVAAIVWWIYRREGDTATVRSKRLLSVLRVAAIVFILLLLFQPYAETSVRKLVKSHLVVLIDTSASMGFIDTYTDADKAERTRRAANLGLAAPSSVPRLELVKGLLTNPDVRLLEQFADQFHLHLYTFDADTALMYSSSEARIGEEETSEALGQRVRALAAVGAYTFLGSAVSDILEEFRLRDEPLAGIVVFTDGRPSPPGGGPVKPVEAARKAAAAEPAVPLFLVGVGDPDLPRNIHVANLRAKEVVLFGDDASFEFTVTHKGFAGEAVVAILEELGPEGDVVEELDLKGADIVLEEEDEEQTVRVMHRFKRPGFHTVRVGIPVQRGEKIENDNFLVHHIRVVDKKIKVLYVEGYPRWEYRFLKNALTRDTETILAHVINLDADPEGVVQPFSDAPGWGPRYSFPETKEELYEYDVLIFGDVDWKRLVPDDEQRSKEILASVKQFVDDGGGFIMIAGPYDSPGSYRNTEIGDVLPVVLSLNEELNAHQDPTRSFNFDLTEAGKKHPIMQLEDDPASSASIWEEDRFSAQFWYYPVEKAKAPPATTVLAVHPGEYNRNKFGQHVLLATMDYGKGRTLFIAVDELWRLRWSFGDLYHYRFYGEAIRMLATYKLLRGTKRFKIFTDNSRYFVGDPVTISAVVYDRDFRPSTEEVQTVTIRFPDGLTQNIDLRLLPDDPGNYRHTVTPTRSPPPSRRARTSVRACSSRSSTPPRRCGIR